MTVQYDLERKLITAICSREGEVVTLNTPIDLGQNLKINEWLRGMEREMQTTLAKMLSTSLLAFSKFDVDYIQIEEYMNWIDSFPVRFFKIILLLLNIQAQIVGIATDVWWTSAIEKCLNKGDDVLKVLNAVEKWLSLLSASVLCDQPSIRRKKIENSVYNLF